MKDIKNKVLNRVRGEEKKGRGKEEEASKVLCISNGATWRFSYV